jgi:anaerobic magnesium-protoporphyrin IX monomethyl ester cyclase
MVPEPVQPEPALRRHNPAEVTTGRAAVYPRAIDELLPSALHTVEQCANNPVEADHGQNLTAVKTLKQLGIWFTYGFMAFDPSSTFESVRQNIAFLRQIVGDGYAAATFCRMLPYGGTPIRDRLQLEGRLRGTVTRPDYDFLDIRLNEYYRLLRRTVRVWIHDAGISHELNWAWDELETVRRLVPVATGVEAYRSALSALTAESNEQLFRLVEDSSVAFERGDLSLLDPTQAKSQYEATRARLLTIRNSFFAQNHAALAEATDANSIRGPVMAPQVH